MSNLMFFLAENYKIGILSLSGVVITLYIYVSMFSLFSSRKKGINVTIGAMIPFWNLKYFFM